MIKLIIIRSGWFDMKPYDFVRRQVDCLIHFGPHPFAGRDNPLKAAYTILKGEMEQDMQADPEQ
ncbi:MAG: hypothetical protein HRU72_12175 [Planctomycetia bacterium]|nr:MAG: hypothetical protein HRU72_12175 [Planctomycetia bacterium]HQU31048.1 hypothetical protein [Candidatus Brocadia sapporoensis]